MFNRVNPSSAAVHRCDTTVTAQIKLRRSGEQALALLLALERADEAYQYISDHAQERGEHSKYNLQEAVYHDMREQFDLTAQMTIRALGKVADAYTTNSDAHNQFDIRGDFPYATARTTLRNRCSRV